MDDLSSPGGSTFHTPEQHHPPPPPGTPATTSAAAATSLPVSTAGKKRHHEEDQSHQLDQQQQQSPSSQGILGRLVSSMTPSRWKRPRSSLEGMSSSAIKSAHRTPAGHGGTDGNGTPQSSNSSTKPQLGKLNLEKKFVDNNSPMDVVANGRGAMAGGNSNISMPVQQATATEQQPKKRVRLGGTSNIIINAAGSNNNNNNQSSATTTTTPGAKTVRIGGTTSFATTPSPYHAFTSSATATPSTPGTKFNVGSSSSATKPKFHMGSASKPKLRDVRGRTSTPGGKYISSSAQRLRSSNNAGSTPGLMGGARRNTGASKGMRRIMLSAGGGGGGLTGGSTLGGNSTVANNASMSNATLGRVSSTGYRRRIIKAGRFKPNSRLLTGIYNAPNKSETNDKDGKGMMITDSIVTQILEESRQKLSLVDNRNNNNERALFGGNAAMSGDSAVDNARTFEEEAAAYRAVTNSSVPRVRMNRVLGSGQIGGRRFGLEPPSTSTAVTAVASATNNAISAAPAPASLLFGKPAAVAPVAAAPQRAATFQISRTAADTSAARSDTDMEDAVATTPKPFEPNASNILSPLGGSDDIKLTPCDAVQEHVSKDVGGEIENMVGSNEWKKKAMEANYGYGSPSVVNPRTLSGGEKTKKLSGSNNKLAPLPQSNDVVVASASTTTATPTAGSGAGAPFSFMPGGAAASSKVSMPAYKYGKTDASPQSTVKSPAKSPAPALASATSPAPAPAASGWGDMFKPKPGQWKCEVCSTQNPKDATACLACEAAKPGADSKSSASASASGTTNGPEASGGSIGAGGFSFGAAPTSANKSSSTKPAASGWGDMFAPKPGEWKCKACMVKNSKDDTKCVACEAPKDEGGNESASTSGGSLGGATPAKSKRKMDDGKASIGAGGFSFGGATAASSAGSGDGSGIGSGGFSFGGATSTATPANTPAKSKRGRDDSEKDDSSSKPSAGGFTFSGSTSTVAESTTKASASGLFSFGATSSSDEKKEDPASSGGFSFGTKAPAPATEKKGGASIPGFQFGAAPASTTAEKDKSAEPPQRKTFTFGNGGSTPSLPMPAGNGAPAPPGTAGFSFGSTTPAATEKKDASGSLFGGTPASKPAESTNTPGTGAAFQFGATSAKKDDAAPSGTFTFGATASKPADSTAKPPAETKADSGNKPGFTFGSTTASTPAPPAPSGGGFSFGAGGSANNDTGNKPGFTFGSTPAAAPKTANTPGPSSGFSFGAATTPAAPSTGGFGAGATPAPAAGGFSFGSASQPTAAPAPAAPGNTFAFGSGAAPAAPSTGSFGASTPAAGFGGFGNASQPAAAPPATPGTTFAFGGTPAAANPTPGFAPAAPAPSFGANASFGATQSTQPAGGGFNIGTGGTKAPGAKRRILKARRPPGTR